MALCERCGDAIRREKTIGADALFNAMATELNYPLGELKHRRRPYVWMLQNIMYSMRMRGCKLTAIADAIGRDHSDVIYGVKQVMKRLALNDPLTAEQLQRLSAVQYEGEGPSQPSTPEPEEPSLPAGRYTI
jgi:chromosomal replication initiation ATPase DnaA